MKFLFKLAVLVIAAKLLLQTPQGKNKQVDLIGGTTVREIATKVDSAVTKLTKTVRDML